MGSFRCWRPSRFFLFLSKLSRVENKQRNKLWQMCNRSSRFCHIHSVTTCYHGASWKIGFGVIWFQGWPLFKWSCCTYIRSNITQLHTKWTQKRPVLFHAALSVFRWCSGLMFTKCLQCKNLKMSRAFWPICPPGEMDKIMNLKRVRIVN